jgi:hypothetical protein
MSFTISLKIFSMTAESFRFRCYKEAMAAPMGSFSNYSREPLGICVVDRMIFTKNRRVGANGAHVIGIDLERKQPLPPSIWVELESP